MLRAALIGLSENRHLRALADLSSLGLLLSQRFVAGTSIEDAVRAAETVNRTGMAVSVDNLGENVTNLDEARHSATLYHQLLDEIEARKLQANISLKLTHMGLDLNGDLARQLVSKLVERAASSTPKALRNKGLSVCHQRRRRV